jgi:hypothetical protein
MATSACGALLYGTSAATGTSFWVSILGAEVLGLLDVLSRRECDLDQNGLADPLGMLGHEDFERVELLRNIGVLLFFILVLDRGVLSHIDLCAYYQTRDTRAVLVHLG